MPTSSCFSRGMGAYWTRLVQRESNTSGGSDMKRRLSLSVFLCLAVSWVIGTNQPAQGQALYGSIVGNVKDSSEAVVAGVSVTLTNLETKQSREMTTTETGSYSFATVSPGIYEIKIRKEGFTPYTRSGVSVTPNDTARRGR